MKNLDRIKKQMSPARRKKIAARAAALVAEEKTLQELRQAHKLTQKRIAEVLGIGQDSVSRLEQRSDLLISTLRGYVEAMGGRLSLVAEFPNQDPVILTGITAIELTREVTLGRSGPGRSHTHNSCRQSPIDCSASSR